MIFGAIFMAVGFSMPVGGDVGSAGAWHGGIWVTDTTQIGEARAHIEVLKKRVVLGQCAKLGDFGLFILEVTKDNGIGGACLLACGLQAAGRNPDVVGVPRLYTGIDLGFFNTLDAEGAFFHDSTHPDGDVRVLLEFDGLLGALGRDRAPVELVQRALVVIEEVKAPDLVWTS